MVSMRIPVNITKWQIFRLSIPIFFSNLAIPLVGIVDTGLMGHLSNEKYLIAVSISTTSLTLILWSFGFLRMGTVGLISQALGKADYRELVHIIIRNIFIALLISSLIIILKPILVFNLGQIFETSIETKKLINDYISIRVFSAPAELLGYVIVGFYLGIQRTIISSLFDLIDGALARYTKSDSISGGFFDAVIDRISESVIYLGLIIFFLEDSRTVVIIILIALINQLVSYVKAKYESYGIKGEVGIFTRTERIIVLSIALIAGSINLFILYVLLYFSILLSLISMMQRIIYGLLETKNK